MTQVQLVCGANGEFRACSARGHAGFAAKGRDIVCAGETSILRSALAVLEQTEGLTLVSDTSSRGNLAFRVKEQTFGNGERLKCIADFIRCGIGALAEEYPECIEMREMKES